MTSTECGQQETIPMGTCGTVDKCTYLKMFRITLTALLEGLFGYWNVD
jgi:hypothetical protein